MKLLKWKEGIVLPDWQLVKEIDESGYDMGMQTSSNLVIKINDSWPGNEEFAGEVLKATQKRA